MRSFIGFVLSGLGLIVCAPIVFGVFIYGIYTLFATSFVSGLMLIGASTVASFIIRLLSTSLMVAGSAVLARGLEADESRQTQAPLPDAPGEESASKHQQAEMAYTVKLTEATCPYCAEIIKKAAILCKHCHSGLKPNSRQNLMTPLDRQL